jgi:DNA-binding beta-propeller fold protein YncE
MNGVAQSVIHERRIAKGPCPGFALIACMMLGMVVLGGCASAPPPKPKELVFPPPPEPARFHYEMTLTSSAQVTTDPKKARWMQRLTGEAQGGEGFSKPFDVTVCKGVVYASDSVKRRVLAFDFPGKRFFQVGDDDPGALFKPLGLANDAACNLYVADGSLRRVMIYDKDGKYQRAIGTPEMFHHLSHVTTDAQGLRLYAVDTGGVSSSEHRIRVFDVANGTHLYDIATRGSEPGKLNLPRDIVLAPDGHLYVVDGGNFRVQVFNIDGTFVRTFGAIGARYGQFSRPKGIAADAAGNIYVADAAFGNFQIFNPQGDLLLFIGDRSEKGGAAKYMLPAGIHVDEDGRVYFVDQYFRKIDIYRPASLTADQGFLAGQGASDPALAGEQGASSEAK